MTYVELIVVLSIFSVMSALSIYNYQTFQDKVDIKNLANDVALKLFEAQNSAVSGKLPVLPPASWKPSYGVYFNLSRDRTSPLEIGPNLFYYFIDLDQNKVFNYDLNPQCPDAECLQKINITKGNYISSINAYANGVATPLLGPVQITFTRPSQSATFTDKDGFSFVPTPEYLEINFSSSSGIVARVKIFPSGRIQLN